MGTSAHQRFNCASEQGPSNRIVVSVRSQFKVKAWERSGKEPEVLNTALDALTVSHIASRFDLDRGPPADWQDMEARAIERLVAAAKRYAADNEDLEAREELALGRRVPLR